MLYFFRTWLSEAYFPMYLLQSLQRHLPVVQSFIFSLKISSDFAFLISQGIISHILEARKDMLFIPKHTVQFLRLCRVKSFLRLYGFCAKWKISFIISGHLSLYKFLSLRFVDFFGRYLLIYAFAANHPKRDLSHLCKQVLKLFCESY